MWFFQMLLSSNFRWGQVSCQGDHLGGWGVKKQRMKPETSTHREKRGFRLRVVRSLPSITAFLQLSARSKRSCCLSILMALIRVLSFFLERFLNLELSKLSVGGWTDTFRCTYIYFSHFWRVTLQYCVGKFVQETLVPISLIAHQPSQVYKSLFYANHVLRCWFKKDYIFSPTRRSPTF